MKKSSFLLKTVTQLGPLLVTHYPPAAAQPRPFKNKRKPNIHPDQRRAGWFRMRESSGEIPKSVLISFELGRRPSDSEGGSEGGAFITWLPCSPI